MVKARSSKRLQPSTAIRTYNRGGRRVRRVRQTFPDDLAGLGPDQDRAWRHDNIGRLFLFAFHAFEERLLQRLHAAGHTEIKHVHFHLFRTIDVTGTRIVDLARRIGVTKAAAGQLVREGVTLGLFRLSTDASDRRAKLVTFTPRGRALHRRVRTGITEMEVEFRQCLGDKRFESLRADLLLLRERLVVG